MSISFLHPVPARIGRYCLASKTATVERRLCINDPQFSSSTSFNIDHAAGALESPAVLFIPTVFLPAWITRDFELAGKSFVDDLRKHCSVVGFCDQIELEGHRADGFTPEMVGDDVAVAKLIAGLDNLQDSVMFVNRRFEDGRPMPDILFSNPMSWLLGRIKVNSHLTTIGQKLDALTATGKDYYATKYQLSFKQASFAALSREASKIPNLPWPLKATCIGANALNDIRKIKAQMAQLKEGLSSWDRLILAALDISE